LPSRLSLKFAPSLKFFKITYSYNFKAHQKLHQFSPPSLVYSDTLNSDDQPAKQKALVAPFKENFDGQLDNLHHFIALFTQQQQGTGVIGDSKVYSS
jgi:hypothetical protein